MPDLQPAKNAAKLWKCIYSFLFPCLLAGMYRITRGLGCYCGFTCLQLFHALFFDILWILRPPLEKQQPGKTRWKICTSCIIGVPWYYRKNGRREDCGLQFHSIKEQSYCNNKGFSWNRTRQVWSCWSVSTPRSWERASCAANAPGSLQGKDCTANTFRPTFPTRTVVWTCPSFLSVPREDCKDVALPRWPFPCLSFPPK